MAMTTASACPQGAPVPGNAPRTATVARTTGETDIAITIDLDGTGSCSIDTGVPFFDHMLDAFGRHGLFDLAVSATGDVEVDAHHTVEDTGIVLGRAFASALGDKTGITRFADACVPMDETLVLAAVDISGRGQAYCDLPLPTEARSTPSSPSSSSTPSRAMRASPCTYANSPGRTRTTSSRRRSRRRVARCAAPARSIHA